MGGTSLTLAPNLSVSKDGIVTFDTRGVAAGYWCTQIKFSDGLCYAVVDFLIYSAPRPRVCSAACSNKGNFLFSRFLLMASINFSNAAVSCTADANCTSCTGGNTGQCVVAQSPYIVTPPTPADGNSYTLQVNTPVSFQWSAYTPNLNANVTLTYSSLPSGSVLTTNAAGSFMNLTLNWTPTLAQVGVYVITLGCYDTGGQTCPGQLSFSISVRK